MFISLFRNEDKDSSENFFLFPLHLLQGKRTFFNWFNTNGSNILVSASGKVIKLSNKKE